MPVSYGSDNKELDIRYIMCAECGQNSLIVYNATDRKYMACCDYCKTLSDLETVILPKDALQ